MILGRTETTRFTTLELETFPTPDEEVDFRFCTIKQDDVNEDDVNGEDGKDKTVEKVC